MLDSIALVILAISGGLLINACIRTFRYRFIGGNIPAVSLYLVNVVFWLLFTLRTVLFYKDKLPTSFILTILPNNKDLKNFVTKFSTEVSNAQLINSILIAFIIFFACAFFVRIISGVAVLRIRHILYFGVLVYSIHSFVPNSDSIFMSYFVVLLVAAGLWLLSILICKIELNYRQGKIADAKTAEAASSTNSDAKQKKPTGGNPIPSSRYDDSQFNDEPVAAG